ncbi:MAG: Na(+)-translocating NADH-quinone reductase subunit A [Waddliaceae bacterium]
MTQIKITKGLDIPIKGKPKGNLQSLTLSGEASFQKKPATIALNLDPFEDVRFKLLAKIGDVVKLGQPLVEDKLVEGRFFVSPAAGAVKEIRRGLKRRLLDIVIEVGEEETYHQLDPLNVDSAAQEMIIRRLKEGGLFAHIRRRPFNRLAHPEKLPKSIFVKAIETAPFTPPPSLQVEGHEEDFQVGLTALSKLTSGSVHLVYHKNSTCKAFIQARDVQHHTAEGPHPVGNHSIHIQHIDPIRSIEDIVWTLRAHDVVVMGHLLNTGRYLTDRVVSIAGPGILPDRSGYFKVRAGYPIESLMSNRVEKRPLCLLSGDPLTGKVVESEDFLGFYDTVLCAIPVSAQRELMHFFRLGLNKYSFSRAYASGHMRNESKEYDFSTSLHGEERAFIDGSLYDKVMPLNVPTMTLVKSLIAEDYDLAEALGLLEVDSEDFALPAFVCPSKMEMIEIVKQGLKAHAAEVLE